MKDFAGVSGIYTVSLILGDALVNNPINWHFADVSINVPKVLPPSVLKSKQIIYEKLPEIKHIFAQPEPRPPQVVSDTFTALCALPLLVLFALVCFLYLFIFCHIFITYKMLIY